MKYCTNCGAQLSDDAKFCSVCGTRQEAPKAPASPKPKAAPKKPVNDNPGYQQNTETRKPEGPQEDFFTASDTEGEVVLSSWENNDAQPPQQQAQTRQQQYAAPPRTAATQQRTTVPPQQQRATVPPQQQRATVPPQQQRATVPPQQQPKKRGFLGWLVIILLVIITLYYLAQILGGCKNINLPPDPGTPVPQPHEGVFVCGNDTLFFNGDGKTVSWHLAEDGSNVPDGVKELGTKGSGTYAFLFSHGKVRYDVAEDLLIHLDSSHNTTFILNRPISDTLIAFIAEKGTIVQFIKTGAQQPVPGN